MNRFLADEKATMAFAGELFDVLPDDLSGWTVLLTGELGAGKSTFLKIIATLLRPSSGQVKDKDDKKKRSSKKLVKKKDKKNSKHKKKKN